MLHLFLPIHGRFYETKHLHHFKLFRRKSFREVLLVLLFSLSVSEECYDLGMFMKCSAGWDEVGRLNVNDSLSN